MVEAPIADVAAAFGQKLKRKIKCENCEQFIRKFDAASRLPGANYVASRSRDNGGLNLPSEQLQQLYIRAYGFFTAAVKISSFMKAPGDHLKTLLKAMRLRMAYENYEPLSSICDCDFVRSLEHTCLKSFFTLLFKKVSDRLNTAAVDARFGRKSAVPMAEKPKKLRKLACKTALPVVPPQSE